MSDRRSEESSGDEPSSSISDEVWEQFLRDSDRDIRRSAPKEPSARAREVTGRLRERKGEPEGWRTGPAWQEMNGRAARRRRAWAVIGVPLAVAVAVVAMRPSLIPGDPFGSTAGTDTATTPLPDETTAPTAPPSAAAADTPTLAHPFAGSPALRWADGAAGIVLPQATALGAIPKGRVELALQQTRKLLVDANLNPEVVAGGRPGAALSVLDPRQPDVLDDLRTSLRSPSKAHDPLFLFSRFDPKEVRPAGKVIKVRGRITFAKGKFEGVAVHADYTFVYPVVRADGSTEVTRTIVRRVIEAELPDPVRYRVTPGRLTLLRFDEDAGNSSCDSVDGYLHPQFPSQAPAGGSAPSGPSVDPYDRSRDIGKEKACGTVSRT
ncbi:hypothetical protein [Streptomyces fuscichromogenes]|uniref:Uncharacterized protein n=1 Tax=Streptomyces fuscichromogenes TaxID=1324013 RepID=A0A918CTV9_9ACTN|nr:hypothetical protein [Streptomyces fuscichromogenes]GGN24188.1 hypothetical protein GCM10011578_057140 [Streptomyces fuscichromogenes]